MTLPDPRSTSPSSDRPTALITGATDGIGLITAHELVRKGYQVWIVSRSAEKTARVANELGQLAPGAPVNSFVADLSSTSAIQTLAEQVRQAIPRLDVLVNNAGALFLERTMTDEGIEKTFALNHLGYFTLTNLLLPLLKDASNARIVSVASDAHRGARGIRFDDIHAGSRYTGWGAYCHSKLANVLFTRELARRLEGTGITANCLHPGFVRTAFMAWPGWKGTLARAGARVAAISPQRGAQTSIYLASDPGVNGETGGYFSKCKRVNPSIPAQDDAAARRLWALSEEMTGVRFPA